MSISLEVATIPSGDRDHPATCAPLSSAGNRVEEPVHRTPGGSDIQAYDGTVFFFFLFVYIQLNSNVLPE